MASKERPSHLDFLQERLSLPHCHNHKIPKLQGAAEESVQALQPICVRIAFECCPAAWGKQVLLSLSKPQLPLGPNRLGITSSQVWLSQCSVWPAPVCTPTQPEQIGVPLLCYLLPVSSSGFSCTYMPLAFPHCCCLEGLGSTWKGVRWSRGPISPLTLGKQ